MRAAAPTLARPPRPTLPPASRPPLRTPRATPSHNEWTPPPPGPDLATSLASPHVSPFDAPALGLSDTALATLAAGYLAGKRKVSVSAVSAAAGVPRAAALAWFKRVDALPSASRSSALAALVAAGDAATVMQTAAAAKRERVAAAEAVAAGPPVDWRPPPSVDRLSASARATLERVADEVGAWPGDAVLADLMKLHRVPRSVALEFFKARRKAVAMAREEGRGERRRG